MPESIRITSLPVLLMAICALLIAGCGGLSDEGKAFNVDELPFTFTAPEGWSVAENAGFEYGSTGKNSVSITLAEPDNRVSVAQYELKRSVPEGENADKGEVDSVLKRLANDAGGTASSTREIERGGLPGYEATITYSNSSGVEVENRVIFLFRGRDQIQITCQSTEDRRSELDAGCEKVADSLAFKT